MLSKAMPSVFKNHFDPEGPLKEEWRIGTTLFGEAKTAELVQHVSLGKFMDEHVPRVIFRPEGHIWNPVRRGTKTYVRRILNASRISKNQLNFSTISPSLKEIIRFSRVDFHKLKWSRK